nr:Chain B, Mini-chromosome maintenance complex-binding protein [Homo sapiens]
RVSPSTSYTP